MGKKILICGATGFIGRNISEFLLENTDYDVYGTYSNSSPFDHPDITFLKADLTNKLDVDEVVKDKDVIIQAAATTSGAKDIVSKPYIHVTDNAVMNALLFRSAFEHNTEHIIFLSCTVMYQSGDKPVKETDFNPNDEIYPKYYGGAWTKIYNEKMCEFYSGIGNTKYTIIRHSNIYGPYDKFDLEKSHVFGATMTKVMTAKDGEKIVVWGSGEEERDLLYVSDLVDFVNLAIEKQKNKLELYNVGLGSSISVKTLVKKIIDISRKNLIIEHDLSKPSIKTRLCLDITKAKNNFGWEPKVSLDEGIKKTMNWYEEYFAIKQEQR